VSVIGILIVSQLCMLVAPHTFFISVVTCFEAAAAALFSLISAQSKSIPSNATHIFFVKIARQIMLCA
jgi:hypothetical protein